MSHLPVRAHRVAERVEQSLDPLHHSTANVIEGEENEGGADPVIWKGGEELEHCSGLRVVCVRDNEYAQSPDRMRRQYLHTCA